MTDLRQGVTETQHAILDMVEAMRTLPLRHNGYEFVVRDTAYLIEIAAYSVKTAAQKTSSLIARREAALDAAARMILAVELLDAEIAASADNPLQSTTLERKA